MANDDYVMGDLARSDLYPDEAGLQPPPPGLLDYLKSGAGTINRGIGTVSQYLGIPQGEIRNAAGDVVYPTNSLEAFLQRQSEPTKAVAAAVMAPGKAAKPEMSVGFAPGSIAEPAVADTSIAAPYVQNPQRVFSPGIYKDPRQLALEASQNVAPEHPAMKELFGVTREELAAIGQFGKRQGNMAPVIPTVDNPRGSATAEAVMTPANAQRLQDALYEAGKYPSLTHGMDAWYVMDPMYQRMAQLVGPEQAAKDYLKFNVTTSMFSPASDVMTEINRGTAGHMFATQGRWPEFAKYGGMAAAKRGADFPPELTDVIGHPYHSTSQAGPVGRYLETGKVDMTQPKVPLYMQASGVPETGFQTTLPVPDAHFTRGVGMADVRQSKNPGVSMKTPEYAQLGPWYRENVAKPLGIEAVPAQARQWGLMAKETGVDTPIGAPKLELFSQKIWERAQRLGIDPRVLRDKVLRGEEHAQLLPGAMGDLASQDQYG